MKISFGKFLIIWPILSIAGSSEIGGFLFIAPRTLLSGYDENICITFQNQNRTVGVVVTILEEKTDNQIATASEEITNRDYGGKCFKISIPRTKIKKGRLQLTIHLKTDEDFRINYIKQISIETNPDVTFIQTDKAIYNGGQIVRFRIFTLRSDLTPVIQSVNQIWIENPNGIRLVQWRNESTNHGFITKTFQLSDEPLPGKWFIKIKQNGEETASQSFQVENYFLPKFSVTIKTPEFINFSTNKVITICAKYIFGEPVHGDVELQYFIKCSFSYYCQESGSSLSKRLKLNPDGCVDYELTLKSNTNFAKNLIINATVVEDGTQIKAKATAKIEIQNSKAKNVPEFSLSTKRRKFKPGLPFMGQVILKGQPDPEERVLLCLDVNDMINCKDFRMDKNMANFIILPVPIKDEKNFKAFLEVKSTKNGFQGNTVTKLNLVPWYSPSGSYLQLENLMSQPLRCGQQARVSILYSSLDSYIQFHYMVKARGDILTKGVLDEYSRYSKPFELRRDTHIINQGNLRNLKEFEFSFDVLPVMSPSVSLIVYFIRGDNEVVADTLHLIVEKCLPNRVKTKWEKNQSLPGSENNFLIETSSSSLCALTITDKSIKLLSDSGDLKVNKVFKEIEKYENKAKMLESEDNRCRKNSEEYYEPSVEEMQALMAMPESDSLFVDSLQAFNDFGTLIITDLEVETRPCKEKGDDDKMLKNATTRNSKLHVFGNEIENISIFEAEDFSKVHKPYFRENPIAYELRSFFPETWIWDLVPINASGKVNLNFKVPHTITEWTAETVCLSSKNGLGISDTSRLITYQPFFLDFAVPYSLKRKEIFHLPVSIFNFESNDLPIKVTLRPLESFISRSEESHSYCIKTKSKIIHRFVLESVKLGEAEIKVTAEIDTSFVGSCGNAVSARSDTVVKKTMVKHEGFPIEEVKSGFICGNSPRFDSQVAWNMRIPPDVVESSISVKALVSGDILGPSLKNVNHLIMLPTGCGEQNMILLVPNILLLEYLLLTKSEDLEPIEKALKNLDLGYQRQLNYKLRDGSYSAFGEQDEKGSIWLTAFVVRYLSQVKKYIHVDENDLNVSITWIMRNQLENGCFPMIGKVYHRKLQEKLMDEDSSKTLTAYILISLIEAGISLDDPVVKNAIYCLKPTEESLGLYGDMLSSYALILAGEYRDSQALMMELLKDAKRSYGMLWWENDESIESAIEMTGYGILSLVKLGGPLFLAAASDAIRWIIQFQNQNGGFISSQDTVLALEAISKFSATLPRTGDHDTLSVTLNSIEKKHTFNIDHSNRLIQQKINLPSFLTGVHFESIGRGCALVQTWMKYNIRRANQNDNFKIQLKIHSVSELDLYSIAKFHICVRYKSPKDKVNMAVLEVSMVSGYYPDRSSLYEIRTSRKGVRRWEEYEDKVNFYFEDLKNRKVCVSFLVVQEVCIENAAPALIKLYDYYDTQHQTTVKYSLIRECQNGSWLDTQSNQLKQESKRDLKYYEDVPVPPYQRSNFDYGNFPGFVDIDEDLETPKTGGDVFPVFALPPKTGEQDRNCPHCLTTIPDIFPQLYCSSGIALKVMILSREAFEFQLDLSPRKNLTSLRRTVSFTFREDCVCPVLESVNSFALLLVTPPRSFRTRYVHELHIDDSIQLYPWGNPNEMPKYVEDAINYCQRWPLNINY